MPLHLVYPHKQTEGEVIASVIETVIPSALKGKQKRFALTQCVIRKLTSSLSSFLPLLFLLAFPSLGSWGFSY